MSDAGPDRVTYAYAVLHGGGAAPVEAVPADLAGVAGAPVRLVPGPPGAELAAAVSGVPAADFQEAALRRHLEDLEWLETVARAHHTVIEGLSARATVLPLRLATVYLDDARVGAMLADGREMFTACLARLEGHLEWGVKIYVEDAPDEAPAAPPAEDAADLSPGRAYLRARRVQRHSREDAHHEARRAAESVAAIGRELAVDHARHRVQQGELAGDAGENVVNDAYLVAREHAEAFRVRVQDAAAGLTGVRVEVTGPWAPYSFAAVPEGAPS
ncbi:GvpL/GvpF family gas vesicle protein [Streptomyces sp. NPDC058691]|uniref:GvpL/GvpF family gas vesicle protein n=1 Tax=Streptomyces sp. NPDC058691 TaxID=3346601 RepID=UPI00365D1B53